MESTVPSFAVTPHGIRIRILIHLLKNSDSYLAMLWGIQKAGYNNSFVCLLLHKGNSVPGRDIPTYTCSLSDGQRLLVRPSARRVAGLLRWSGR